MGHPVLMLLVPAVWAWAARRRRRGPRATPPLPWDAVARLVAPFLVDVTGNTLDRYDAVKVGEYLTFIRHGTELAGAYTDTLGDGTLGTLDTLGALLAALLVAVHPSRRGRACHGPHDGRDPGSLGGEPGSRWGWNSDRQ